MVNHPSRSKQDPSAMALRLLRKHQITAIDVRFSLGVVSARATPNQFHPLIAKRRNEAFAKLSDSISIAEATEINDRARSEPVASAAADTLEGALAALSERLDAVKEPA